MVGCFTKTQFKHLNSLINAYLEICKNTIIHNQILLQQQEQMQEQHLYLIFNKTILLAKPQTIQKKV